MNKVYAKRKAAFRKQEYKKKPFGYVFFSSTKYKSRKDAKEATKELGISSAKVLKVDSIFQIIVPYEDW